MIKKELLGEISLENIEFWFNIISGIPFMSTNIKFNEYLQDIHKKLFTCIILFSKKKFFILNEFKYKT